MSVAQEYDQSAAAAVKAKVVAKLKVFNVVPVALAWGLLLAIFAGLRIYLQLFAFKYGLELDGSAFRNLLDDAVQGGASLDLRNRIRHLDLLVGDP